MSEEAPARGGFELNGPTIVALLYLATWFTLLSAVLGVMLAHAWRRQDVLEWQRSLFGYLIRTFWIGVGGYVAGVVPAIALIAVFGDQASVPKPVIGPGFVVALAGCLALTVWLLVRGARAIVAAQQRVAIGRGQAGANDPAHP